MLSKSTKISANHPPMPEEYNAIDVAKFLCAIMIVMIHVAPFGSNEKYTFFNFILQNYLSRIAVPFFFTSTGFFLYKKTTNNIFSFRPSKDYVLRIFRLYITWSIIYLPLYIENALHNNHGVLYNLFVYIRNFIFVGTYTHLWYLNATIIGVLMVSLMLKKNYDIKIIIALALSLYLIGLLAQSCYVLILPIKYHFPTIWSILKLFQKIICTTRNGFFEAFIFIGIGMIFALKEIKIKTPIAIIGFFSSLLFLFIEICAVEYFEFSRANDMYLFLVPTAFFMFYLIKKIHIQNHKAYKLLRILSSLIFYLHIWVRTIVFYIFSYLGIDIGQSSLAFLLTLTITIIASLLIIKLSNLQGYGWLKKLYC